MGIIVQKFGGTSVATAERILNVANRVAETYKLGNKVIVVVSAQGDTTDDLIQKAKEVNIEASKREMDVLLSTGEQISMSLLAMAIEKIGFAVVSLTGAQAGIFTDSDYGNARIKSINTERIQREIDKRNIVIVAGFQGMDRFDDITTLGRGGSDTTAVAIAAAIKADICEIYTDVDGIYTADPRTVKNASKLSQITYDEMLELASLGANVLHNRSVELAKKYNVDLRVRSSFSKDIGTIVREESKVESIAIRGVTRDNDTAQISVLRLKDIPGQAFKLFSLLSKENINVDVIVQSAGSEDTQDISFTVSRGNLERSVEILKGNIDALCAEQVTYSDDISKVSIVGAGMVNNTGVATKMFEALYDSHINIHMISTSEIKISVIINREDSEKAIQVIHDKFRLEMVR